LKLSYGTITAKIKEGKMDTQETKKIIEDLLEEKNAGDILSIDISKKSSIADYFIIATGKNLMHVRALVDHTESKLEEKGITVARKEGYSDGRWVVLDYIDIIVHIFNSETRDYYCLEKLWK
jgi:ribosome-associated protein